MRRSKSQSINALAVNSLVEKSQQYFVAQLEKVADSNKPFKGIEWLRDEGQHGGGVRFISTDETIFNRASVNVSHVHYDDNASKNLASATAISTIIHPQNPFAPSVHMHISWTEMKDGKGYWRLMADLNPAIENDDATTVFVHHLQAATLEQYELAAAQGDRYFKIPALGRNRGVSHFYLEEYNTGDSQADLDLAKSFGKVVIETYVTLLQQAIQDNPNPTGENYQKQLAYHTLYMFQVLTLDRGTTSGLLVHNQNDLGIMGSLPAQVDKNLLATWVEKLPSPQEKLLIALLQVLPDRHPCYIDKNIKLALADVVRNHYKLYPQALSLQAQGYSIPPTTDNHK